MEHFFQFLGSYWWLIFVFGGSIGGAVKAIGAANNRRADRRQERYLAKQQTKIAVAQSKALTRKDEQVQRREIAKVLDEHNQTDARWFGYETDLVTLLDYPMMIDMREALTVDFHKAKRLADLLLPDYPDALLNDEDAQTRYREAVHAYAVAFDIAETEARRRRQGGFALEEQARLARAQNLLRLALDEAATPQERQNAYLRARRELDGLIVMPTAACAELEQQIAGQLEA